MTAGFQTFARGAGGGDERPGPGSLSGSGGRLLSESGLIWPFGCEVKVTKASAENRLSQI